MLFTGERFVSSRDGDFDTADTQLAETEEKPVSKVCLR